MGVGPPELQVAGSASFAVFVHRVGRQHPVDLMTQRPSGVTRSSTCYVPCRRDLVLLIVYACWPRSRSRRSFVAVVCWLGWSGVWYSPWLTDKGLLCLLNCLLHPRHLLFVTTWGVALVVCGGAEREIGIPSDTLCQLFKVSLAGDAFVLWVPCVFALLLSEVVLNVAASHDCL